MRDMTDSEFTGLQLIPEGAGLALLVVVVAFGLSRTTLASDSLVADENSGEFKLDPPNYWFSSYSQGLGIMGAGQWDVEANLYGMDSHFTGLDQSQANGGGLQSGQFSLRRQISGAPGLDLGIVVGGSYLSQGTLSGDVPSRGVSGFLTAHYAAKIYQGLGAGAYAQIGGATTRTGNDAWSETPVASITPVLAWEREGSVLGSLALNPVAASYTKTGQLSQGPSLRNLTGVGVNFGAGLNVSDNIVLTPEFSYVRSNGSALLSSGQSASSDTYRWGVVDTISFAGHGSQRPRTNSISFGIWYYEEDGDVSGPSSPGSASGRFVTKGVLIGATFGFRP
jgi:hypothetical protein